MKPYLFALATILLGAYGQLVLKSRSILYADSAAKDLPRFYLMMLSDPWVLSAFIGAFVAAGFWMLAVRDLALSVLYPILAGSFVLVPVGSALLLGDRIGKLQALGMLAIVIGIILACQPE